MHLQLVDYLLKSMDEHTEEAKEAEEQNRLPVRTVHTTPLRSTMSLCTAADGDDVL